MGRVANTTGLLEKGLFDILIQVNIKTVVQVNSRVFSKHLKFPAPVQQYLSYGFNNSFRRLGYYWPQH